MKHIAARRLAYDLFTENPGTRLHRRVRILGGDFEFDSNSRGLLDRVDIAYRGLPAHAMSANRPRLRISLRLGKRDSLAGEPPEMTFHGGAGLLCGTMDPANFAVMAPSQRSGLVAVSRDMLG